MNLRQKGFDTEQNKVWKSTVLLILGLVLKNLYWHWHLTPLCGIIKLGRCAVSHLLGSCSSCEASCSWFIMSVLSSVAPGTFDLQTQRQRWSIMQASWILVDITVPLTQLIKATLTVLWINRARFSYEDSLETCLGQNVSEWRPHQWEQWNRQTGTHSVRANKTLQGDDSA